MQHSERLPVRWDYLFSVYRSFFAFAVMTLCVRRFVRVLAV
jgi:hypothetical protein